MKSKMIKNVKSLKKYKITDVMLCIALTLFCLHFMHPLPSLNMLLNYTQFFYKQQKFWWRLQIA